MDRTVVAPTTEGTGPPVADRAGQRRPLLRRPWVAGAGLFAVLLAVCAPVVTLHEHRSRPLFVLDEFAYADYLHKVHDGQPFVRRGEVTGQATLRELACRGYTPESVWPRAERPPCDAPSFDPSVFPNAGVDSADVHPPTYFLVTDLGARLLMGLGVTSDLIDAGRLFGAAWMAAGLLALWYLARALGASKPAAALALGLVAANPALRWEWYYLTPDAANILIGSLVVLAALRWERAGRGLAPLAGAGGLAMAFKAPNLVVVLAVALYLAGRALVARGGRLPLPPRRYALAAATVLGGAGAAAVAWLGVRLAVAVPGATSPLAAESAVSGLALHHLSENVARFVNVWDDPSAGSYPLAVLASYLLVGSLLAAAVALGRADRRHTLALAGGTMAVAGPVLLIVAIVVVTGTYFTAEARYGATLVPLEAAIAASLWRGRAALWAVAALVVGFNVAVLVSLLRG